MKKSIIIAIAVIGIVLLSSISIKVHININKPKTANATPKATQRVDIPSKYVGHFKITHYCSCPKCTGTPTGSRTSTGHKPREGRTVAVDPKKIPLHSLIYIEGIGTFVAEDVGGDIVGNRLDVYVDDHEKALKLGTLGGKKFKVYILE